jgi:putative flippase GtrA
MPNGSTPRPPLNAATVALWLQRHEFLRFLVTGTINTGMSWVVYLIVRHSLEALHVHPVALTANIAISTDKLAFTVAYIFGVLFTYYMNSRWVFRVPMNWRSFLQFPSVYVVQYSAGIVLMHLLVDRLAFPVDFAPLAVIVLTMPITFVLSRFVLKRHTPR